MKKAYSANQNRVLLFSHVDVYPINDRIKAFGSQSESCIVYIQIAFQIWRLFHRPLLPTFLRRQRRALDLCQIVVAQTCLYGIKQTRTHRANQRDVSLFKKNLVSRNELREIENIAAKDVDVLIANFLLQVREFLFLICVTKTISMKILVLRVIDSCRLRNCFVRGYIHSLFLSKALTNSYLARSGFHANNS